VVNHPLGETWKKNDARLFMHPGVPISVICGATSRMSSWATNS